MSSNNEDNSQKDKHYSDAAYEHGKRDAKAGRYEDTYKDRKNKSAYNKGHLDHHDRN